MVDFKPKQSSISFKPTIQKSIDSGSINETGDIASLSLLASGIGAGIWSFFKPARDIKEKEAQLNSIKNKYLFEPGISSSDVPSRISDKFRIYEGDIKQKNLSLQSKIRTTSESAKKTSQQLKSSIDNFENKVFSGKVDQMTSAYKKIVPEFFDESYRIYGGVLNKIEDSIEKSGSPLNGNSFVKNVIQKTIEDSIYAGVPEEKLKSLVKFNDEFQFGAEAPFKSLKNSINLLSEDVPKETIFKLKENWGKFLEDNSPSSKAELQDLNKSYSEVAKLRKALYKTVDPQTGEFDRNKLNKMFKAYAKSRVKTGIEEQIRLISEGNKSSKGMPEVAKPFNELKESVGVKDKIVKKSTSAYSKKLSDVSKMKLQLESNKIAIEKARTETEKWVSRANKILSEKREIAEKHPIRSGMQGRIVRRGADVGVHSAIAQGVRAGLGKFTLYPMISSLVNSFIDPAQAIGQQVGVDVPNKGTVERYVLDEFSTGAEIPKSIQVTEEDKFEILRKYGLAL